MFFFLTTKQIICLRARINFYNVEIDFYEHQKFFLFKELQICYITLFMKIRPLKIAIYRGFALFSAICNRTLSGTPQIEPILTKDPLYLVLIFEHY